MSCVSPVDIAFIVHLVVLINLLAAKRGGLRPNISQMPCKISIPKAMRVHPTDNKCSPPDCRVRSIRVLVLDSPLVAYWKPEGDEDDLSGTDLKEKFYEYLLGLKAKALIIIIGNEHPPDFVEKGANVIVFKKNPHQGRYGLFPHGG